MSNPPRVEDPELARTRSKSRESMFLLAIVKLDGVEKPLDARVRNLSAGGMMVDATMAHEKGKRLTATIKNIGDVHGHVAWSTATRMGIAFDTEIDPKLARQPVKVPSSTPDYIKPVVGRRPGLTVR